jgi:hypothetical protein
VPVNEVAFELELAGETANSATANFPTYKRVIADLIDGVEANQVEITVQSSHFLRKLAAGVVLRVSIKSNVAGLVDRIEAIISAFSFVPALTSKLADEGITSAVTIDTATISRIILTAAPTPAPGWEESCTIDTNSTLYALQPEGFPLAVTSGLTLPQSAPNQLLFLRQISVDCSAMTVARSYDGRAWEGVMPMPLQPTCTLEGACSIIVPSGTAFRIEATAGFAREPRHAISRLLRQATFGPSTAGIQRFLADYGTANSSVMKWVEGQIAMPPTLTRVYYRERANPVYRESDDVKLNSNAIRKRIIKPCEAGSRWHRDAFNFTDYGKTLSVSEGGATGMLALRIDGLLRTEVKEVDWPAPRPMDDHAYVLCYHKTDGNPDSQSSYSYKAEWGTPGDWVIIAYDGDCSDTTKRFRILVGFL